MQIDLNLFRVFDTLMELRSVTRAADRLGVTQSAISHALGRLRQALDDPLFLRSAQGLQPTARAIEMAAGVREGLRRINLTLAAPHATEPDTGRRFNLAASPYFCTLLLPPLIGRARLDMPSAYFQVVPVGDQLLTALDRGDVDLAFGTFSRAPGRFVIEPVFEDEMVWVAAPDSAEAKLPFDAERIGDRPRVGISAGQPFGPAAQAAAADRLTSSFAIFPSALDEMTVVYDSQTALALVEATEMVALVPGRIAARARGLVKVLGPERDGRFSTSMLWHSRRRADPTFERLRGLIRATAATL